ncbi:MAG: hypothetical protein WAM60_13965 [Candidatus Promineifilaceae bacterium]
MNYKYDKQLQKVRTAYRDNQVNITNLLTSQTCLEQQMMRLNMAQAFAKQGVTRRSHPWPHLAGEK